MLTKILEIRAWILKIYQKIRFILNPALKFIFSLLIFTWINEKMGYNETIAKPIISVLMAAFCAITPLGVITLLTMGLTLAHIYALATMTSMLLLAFLAMLYVVLYGLMLRFAPKYSVVAVALPYLMGSNLHFAVPLLLGSIGNPLTALPTACGVIFYKVIDVIVVARSRQVDKDLDDVVNLYKDIIDTLINEKEMFVMIVVFTLVIVVVWAIRRVPLDYAFEISIGAGVVTNILGFLIADLKFDCSVNIGSLIGMSLVCGLIAMLCDYMKRILDYTRIERVQFEDDDYYYYVKAVPKTSISLRKLDIRHFNRKAVDDEEYEYEEETEDADYENNDELEKKAHKGVMSFFAGLGKKNKGKSDSYEEEYSLEDTLDEDEAVSERKNGDDASEDNSEYGYYDSEGNSGEDGYSENGNMSDFDEYDGENDPEEENGEFFDRIDISDMLSVDDDDTD